MRFAGSLVASLVLVSAVVPACSDPLEVDEVDAEADGGPDRPTGTTTRADGGRPDAGRPDAGRPDAGNGEAGAADACQGELDTYDACGLDGMQCEREGYVAWCRANEAATDSAQRIAARRLCLGTDYCEPAVRSDCIYEQYNNLTLSPAQTTLLEHYCAACEPMDQAACKARTLQYDGNPGSTDTIFLAAWELSATLVQQIDGTCIDAATQGNDGDTCAERFDRCAGGYYVDALVADCPAN